jgi:hypothetical protein
MNKLKINIILLSLTFLFFSCGKNDKTETKPDTTKITTKQIAPDTTGKKRLDTLNHGETKLFKGNFSYYADVSVFVECGKKDNLYTTGPENATLEREYLKVRKETNEKIYTEVEGYLGTQMNEENGEIDQVLIVTKFIKVDKNVKCK